MIKFKDFYILISTSYARMRGQICEHIVPKHFPMGLGGNSYPSNMHFLVVRVCIPVFSIGFTALFTFILKPIVAAFILLNSFEGLVFWHVGQNL